MTEVLGDVTYIGNAGAGVLQNKQPSFSKLRDTYELDTASLTFDGAPSRIAGFIDTLARGAYLVFIRDDGVEVSMNKMFMVNASKNDNPNLCEATLSFIGYIDDLPPVEVKDSLATANVTTTITTTGGTPTTLSLTIEYKAARTMYSWFTDERPDPNIPLYTDVTNTTSPFDETNHRITKWTIGGSAPVGTSISLVDFIGLIYSLSLQTNFEDYQISQVIVDKIWKCSVCVQATIIGI